MYYLKDNMNSHNICLIESNEKTHDVFKFSVSSQSEVTDEQPPWPLCAVCSFGDLCCFLGLDTGFHVAQACLKFNMY